ncbi:MAG: endonuclease/exonuclease/phosphatase family protein [Pseudomonadales bacterium]|jgi:endonuclease/exonuclease/phosphatase family metal-dependent hydrolase|nr:endonuclease/exonuclease/phosphatase family protein [Pseudomonadales bacterium]
MQFSVLTYNIHKGFSGGNRQFVLHRMRELLREVNVDVALLQEVQGEHLLHSQRIRHWPDVSQFEFLADAVWPHYAYGKNAIADGRHHGNAVLSKFPFQHWGNINLSPWRFASRSLLHGTVTLATGQRLHLVCLHLGLISLERRDQLRRLNQHLHQTLTEHDAVLVGGDFNDWTGRQVKRWLDPALGLRESFHLHHQRFARTFPARWPLLRVDRLYFRGLELLECQRLDGAQWRELSDHIPLLARFNTH